MRLFISYARVDKGICMQVAQMIDVHDVWFDLRLYAGDNWWEEILNRLHWCDAFIYLLSPDSVESEYCQREYKLAHKLGKPILPILVESDTQIPEDLSRLQYADLTGGVGIEIVKMLLNTLYRLERKLEEKKPPTPQEEETAITTLSTETSVLSSSNATTIIGKAADAMETGKFDEAVFLLKQAKEKGYKSKFVNIEALLVEAEVGLERQAMMKDIEREYRTISELVKRPATRKLGCQAFRAFRKDFPDYDPEELIKFCVSASQNSHQTTHHEAKQLAPRVDVQPKKEPEPLKTISLQDKDDLPLLEWCDIPEGRLWLPETANAANDTKPQSIKVNRFLMAKYPVTNAQFDIFIKEPEGYANEIWWEYSSYAIDWHRKNPHARSSRFLGDDRPRENICWYEAMAYCYWLSDRLNKIITLPSRVQWRRAAQGDSNNLYAWGETFDKNNCNTRESRIRMTTLVMRYMNGVSPFGVYDMAGNVWEWCLDVAQENTNVDTLKSNAPRTVMGGSYKTSYHRAQSTFHFHLDPDYHYGTIGFRVIALA